MDVAPNHPNHSQRVLRRPETSVSGDSDSTFFLGLTTGSDKAGVFCPHGRIPIFPNIYTGGPEDINVRFVDVAPRPPEASLQVLRWPRLLSLWMRPPASRRLNLCPEGPFSSCRSGRGAPSFRSRPTCSEADQGLLSAWMGAHILLKPPRGS